MHFTEISKLLNTLYNIMFFVYDACCMLCYVHLLYFSCIQHLIYFSCIQLVWGIPAFNACGSGATSFKRGELGRMEIPSQVADVV